MEIENPRLPEPINKQNIENAEIKVLNIRDSHGIEVPTPCVEFTVISKRPGNPNWRDFLTVEEFSSSNADKFAGLINKN